MIRFLILTSLLQLSKSETLNNFKQQFCGSLDCDKEIIEEVCGIREEGTGFRLRLFQSMCELFKFGCKVENDDEAFGSINIEYCRYTFSKDNPEMSIDRDIFTENIVPHEAKRSCPEFDCSYPGDSNYTCGLRKDDNGFRVRLFKNKCQLRKHNCESNFPFNVTDLYICSGLEVFKDSEFQTVEKEHINEEIVANKNLFIVDGLPRNLNNINDTIDNFFAATHVFDLPVEEIPRGNMDPERRMIVNRFGPQMVFKPWIDIPRNRSDDRWHAPTLSSCYHQCPTKCPETYAPVCGVPGIVAREPSLMFQNHCFMDIAQCKMFWEDKSDTAQSSAYIESSFLFCLGDEMNGMFRFLPLVRTLQHMGRLKKRGHFRYKLKNLRFFNNFLSREPKLMG